MLRIKLFAMTLVVGLAGVVYAGGGVQTGSHHNHGAQSADKAPACCQKKDAQKDGQAAAMSCDKDGCCQGHKADAQQARGESCCAGGGGCCKAHQQKTGDAAAVVKTSATDEAESCCAGGSCCKDGCCKGHKAAGQTAAADQKHEGGCDCCGDSCAAHAGR